MVSITSPVANASLAAPASVTISASAADANGTVSKVSFYNGSTLLGTDSTSPYSFTWNNVAAGSYTITAKATDNGSLETTSAGIAISVYTPNVAPTVSITSPVANASFAAPASVTISAAAADANGTVSKVSFYNGTTLLGTDSTSPYSFTWNNVTTGNYTITAKATDNGSVTTTSAAVAISVYTPNVAPTVSITSPVANASLAAPASVTISAAAADANGTINKVSFYNGSNLLGTDSTSPYSFTWNNVAAGNYTITVKATDNNSVTTTSAAVVISVYMPGGAPSVSITSPVANVTFAAPGSVTISASAADTDGTIKKVEFYNRDTLLGTDTVSPYTYTWNNVAAGSYIITAKATDNSSLVTVSAPVNISVYAANIAPTVSITNIATSVSLGSTSTVSITAGAADSDGTISKVDFYSSDTLLGTTTVSPYTFSKSDIQPGTYVITAKATDNRGAVTTSVKVVVTIVAPVISLKSLNNSNTTESLTKDTSKSLNLKLYPNPAVSKIQISVDGLQASDEKATLIITNLSGIVVKRVAVNLNNTIQADISSLNAGMYIATIVSDNTKTSKKFVKN
jgi:uncharacterized protein YqfB (UPF0267 family)